MLLKRELDNLKTKSYKGYSVKLTKVLFFILLFSTQAFSADGRILFLKGKAWKNKKRITKKTQLHYGDTLLTDKDSMLVVKINPGATIKIKPQSSFKILAPKKKSSTTYNRYLLKFGEAFVKAKRTKTQRYHVKARNAVMGVRGTQFFISVSNLGNKDLWMCVNEGQVEVSVEGNTKTVKVNAGEGILVNSNQLPEVKKYDWTKKLNWKMQGSYKDIKDETHMNHVHYDIKSFDYE